MGEEQKNHSVLATQSLTAGEFTKGRIFLSCGINDPLNEIIAKMRDNRCYAAIVLENGNFSGLLSEHNIIHALAWELEGARNLERLAKAFNMIRAGDVMIRNPVTVTAGTKLEEALQALTENRFCYIPVMDRDKPVGMLSITEVMQYMEEKNKQEVKERDMLLSHLMNHENYGCM